MQALRYDYPAEACRERVRDFGRRIIGRLGVMPRWRGGYLTSIVVTLSAGSVSVNDDPLTAICPAATGWTGFCPCAEAAVIWYKCAIPERDAPLMAVTCAEVERLMATNTTRPGVELSELAYTTTFFTLLEVACSDVSPKLALATSKARNDRNHVSAQGYVPAGRHTM